MIITIDGPTASGKSTIGRLLAKDLKYYYLYTGLLYRALAHLLIKYYGYTLETIAHPDMKLVDQLLDTQKFVYFYEPTDRERIVYDGVDITDQLRGDKIGQGASLVSTNPQVRERLDLLQQAIANDHDVVIDGRDSGSVVFPHAEHKFFLTASEDERATRWQKQQMDRGIVTSFSDAQSFISSRDQRDSSRAIAPLTIPIGAQVIDATHLTVTQVLKKITSALI
jgi:CMP/dCMP kinase